MVSILKAAPVVTTLIATTFIGLGSATARADIDNAERPLQGAAKVLSEIGKADQASAAPATPVHSRIDRAALGKDLQRFAREVPALPAAQASLQWLQLFDRVLAADMEGGDRDGESNHASGLLRQAIAALPSPDAWDTIAQGIKQRAAQEAGLQQDAALQTGFLLLAHLLEGDAASQQKDIALLQKLAGENRTGAKSDETRRNSRWVSSLLDALAVAISDMNDDPERVLQSVELRMASFEPDEQFIGRLNLPDLVTLVGPQKAEGVLRRALRMPAKVSIETGDATRDLARKLALEMIHQLKAPQWSLANSMDGASLYEALLKKFPPGGKGKDAQERTDYEYLYARNTYLLSLIATGRTDKAVTLVTANTGAPRETERIWFEESHLERLRQGGRTDELYDFLQTALLAKPDLALWPYFVRVAAHAEKTGPMLQTLRTVLKRKDLKAETRHQAGQTLYRALLADNRTAGGVAELRHLVQSSGSISDAVALARLGRLLKQPALVEEGIKAALAIAASAPVPAANQTADEAVPASYQAIYEIPGLVKELAHLKWYGTTEKVLTDVLKRAVVQTPEEDPYSGQPQQRSLMALAGLYHDAGRYQDVIKLLDDAPYWKAKDLAQILTKKDYNGRTLGYLAAVALAKTEQQKEKPEALTAPLLETLLIAKGGSDPTYQLWLAVHESTPLEQKLEFLDQLYNYNRFEERPLIWKAHLLSGAKRYEEAEAVVRQAIAIDPSDGEQPQGDRMRAYGELAEIRAARGDEQEASLFNDVLEAIRLAEQADEYYAAGLLQQGIEMYEKSLLSFADAYCIQSRLALQLSEQGRHEEAEAHYRKAYELMPDSFGRMESHCFGCEGVFNGKRAQNAAEKVFGRLLQETPEKPQVHYLLGYLREKQERPQEALQHYREAVRLDPDYLNAWKHLQELSTRLSLPSDTRDQAAYALLRLDPGIRHAVPDLSNVRDLKQLWHEVDKALKRRPPARPDTLYPLAASATRLKQQQSLNGFGESTAVVYDEFGEVVTEEAFDMDDWEDYALERPRWKSASQAVASHQAVSSLVNLLSWSMARNQEPVGRDNLTSTTIETKVPVE